MRLPSKLARLKARLKRKLKTYRRRAQSRWRPFIIEDPRFRDLIETGHRVDRVATGFRFTEGPVWIAEAHHLLFSDIDGDTIYRFDPATDTTTVFRQPSHHSNGLTRARQGRLVICEYATRRVTRLEADGSVTVLADRFDGKPLNSPKDAIVAHDGSIYFTDPPYGIAPSQPEQPCQGVYCRQPSGELILVARDFQRPNGLVLTPDETQLYIDDSERLQIHRFDRLPDGRLTNEPLFCPRIGTAAEPPDGLLDGLTVDSRGNLYSTGGVGLSIFAPDGTRLGRIRIPEATSNCAWGDRDCRSLYVTARTSLYRVRFRHPGVAAEFGAR